MIVGHVGTYGQGLLCALGRAARVKNRSWLAWSLMDFVNCGNKQANL